MSNFKIIQNVNSAPVSVQNLRRHLSLWDDNSFDTELGALLLAATEFVSDHVGYAIAPMGIEMNFNSFTDLTLAHKNASAIVVKYYDDNNEVQTLSNTNYSVDPTGDYTIIKLKNIPVLSTEFQNPIFVQYVTTMNPVPRTITHAVLMTAAELFEVRTESTDAKARVASITIERLLRGDRKVVV